MKSLKIGLTAVAMLMGIVSVFANKAKAALTTYTNGKGAPLTREQVALCPNVGQVTCAVKYFDHQFVTIITKP
jgi:hypothetical protein